MCAILVELVSSLVAYIVNPEFHVGVKGENNVCVTHPL